MRPGLIRFDEVTFAHPGKHPILSGLSFTAGAGDLVLIVGPSGAGKSTLLKLPCRLLSPTAGRIEFGGRPIEDLPVTELRRRLTYLPQTPVMLPGSVHHNLTFSFEFGAAKGRPVPPDDYLRTRLDELGLDGIALTDEADRLSVGQAQRVALLRALLIEPEALLLDEPTSALDQKSAEVVMEVVTALNRDRGLGVWLVTHQVPELAPGVLIEFTDREVRITP
jgi:putative ABC transport system ATP-binding protein